MNVTQYWVINAALINSSIDMLKMMDSLKEQGHENTYAYERYKENYNTSLEATKALSELFDEQSK